MGQRHDLHMLAEQASLSKFNLFTSTSVGFKATILAVQRDIEKEMNFFSCFSMSRN